MQLITGLATLAAAISSVNAMGSAIINNNCDFDVYMWAVDAQRNPGSPTVIKSKGSYSEQYHTPTSGGVSLKLSKTSAKQYITQFEYTVQAYESTPFLWYDGSNVDCTDDQCPFWSNGIHLQTTDPSCPTRDCAVNQVCTGFYTLYNDDINSLSCGQDKDTIMTLCSVNTGSGSVAASGGSSVSKVSAVSATTPVAATPVASSTKKTQINEAVATTLVTAYARPSRGAKPKRDVHHNHMHFHQHREAEKA